MQQKKKCTDYTWGTLPQKEKDACHKWVYEKATKDPKRPHGFSKRYISFMVRLILYDPLHANHNHAKYNMCSTFMVSINFVEFFEVLFPELTCDEELVETPTHKWGLHRDSDTYKAVLEVKGLVGTLLEIFESEADMKIQSDKTKKTILLHKKNLTSSKFTWRNDGKSFRGHFEVIHEMHTKLELAIATAFELADKCQFRKSKNTMIEIRNTLQMYMDVTLCLFWDAVLHRNLSQLNSKSTLSRHELSIMILIGLDMLANFNTVGLHVTYNMRFEPLSVICVWI